jgi:putative component of membrane protein insertase Oxa1/YidC/SpoIIIJ protein YidD
MKRFLLLFLLLFLLPGSVPAQPTDPPPQGENQAAPILAAPIHFFRHYLSGADGHRCPMSPSCSGYALQAMQRHGALKGWIMTCDRLLRCGRDELKRCSSVMTRQGPRCRDTVDANDIWRH